MEKNLAAVKKKNSTPMAGGLLQLGDTLVRPPMKK